MGPGAKSHFIWAKFTELKLSVYCVLFGSGGGDVVVGSA